MVCCIVVICGTTPESYIRAIGTCMLVVDGELLAHWSDSVFPEMYIWSPRVVGSDMLVLDVYSLVIDGCCFEARYCLMGSLCWVMSLAQC